VSKLQNLDAVNRDDGNFKQILDHEWFEANLNPQEYRSRLGIAIPDLPSDEVQLRFTGRTGRENLQQAFDFYKFILANLPKSGVDRQSVLDFGGGWGRILRFFLREFPVERLFLVDCLTAAIECARSLNAPFNIIQSNVNPPVPLQEGTIGVCYAFSVFSHLSERGSESWLRHLADLLVPGGKLTITTRGKAHINNLEEMIRTNPSYPLAALLPQPETIRKEYEQGVFQFYPVGGGGELSKDIFGETWISRRWLEERYISLGFSACDFYTEFETIDQCVFVLTK
jgi:SAM-dependent methyltransferase